MAGRCSRPMLLLSDMIHFTKMDKKAEIMACVDCLTIVFYTTNDTCKKSPDYCTTKK